MILPHILLKKYEHVFSITVLVLIYKFNMTILISYDEVCPTW
jgi:hypothetical protein